MRPRERLRKVTAHVHIATTKPVNGIALLCLLCAAGCGPYEIPPAGIHHPANPQAAAAPEAAMTDFLEIDEGNLPQMPPEMKQSEMHKKEHDH